MSASADHCLATADVVIGLGSPVPAPRPRQHAISASTSDEVGDVCRNYVHSTSTKTLLVWPAEWRGERDAEVELARQHIRCAMQMGDIRDYSLWHQGPRRGRGFLRALPLLRSVPWANRFGAIWDGLTVFVVGAGPSLERNRHLLHEAATKGVVLAVNTSCGSTDAPLDAIVSVESVDVSSGLLKRAGETVHILDLCCHPRLWRIPHRGQLAMCLSDGALRPHIEDAGGEPLHWGAGCTSAAASLALQLGAARVVLVGQDLAYTGGQAYAAGTPFEDLRVDTSGANATQTGGDSKRLNSASVLEVPAWGGGTIRTTTEWLDMLQWWGRFAARHPRYLVDATEGGASIPGAVELPLRHVLDGLPTLPAGRKPDLRELASQGGNIRYSFALDNIRRQAMALRGSDAEVLKAAERCPIANMWVVPQIRKLNSEGKLRPDERARRFAEAIREAGRAILEEVER